MLNRYNFSPGPACLPEAVYARIRDDWDNRGQQLPLLEMGHRSDEFSRIAEHSEQILRRLLKVPSHYKILFLPGGATAQYAMVPLNLSGGGRPVDYFDTGHWSQRAIAEAQRYARVKIVTRLDDGGGVGVLDLAQPEDWQFSDDAAYCHVVDNETLTGFELPPDHACGERLWVADMTSNFLTRPFALDRYALVYAGAQKNAGIAGITMVIVREDLLDRAQPHTPTLYRYRTHVDAGSRYNTPPIFAWYVGYAMLEWIESEGGVEEMQRRRVGCAERVYQCIDASALYENRVAPCYRSRVNVHFHLRSEALERQFLLRAEQRGLLGLRGHRATGGIRASLYNGMPMSGVCALTDFMRDFEQAV